MNSGVCKHKFCELTQSCPLSPCPLPQPCEYPRFLSLSPLPWSPDPEMLLPSFHCVIINRIFYACTNVAVVIESRWAERTTTKREEGQRDGGLEETSFFSEGGVNRSISMDSSLITDFIPLSVLYMMKRWEALPYFTVCPRFTPLHSSRPTNPIPFTDSFNPGGLQASD